MVHKEKSGNALKFLTEIFDFFLPRLCPSCGNKLNPGEESICVNCLLQIKPATAGRLSHDFQQMFKSKGIIAGFTSLYIFEKDKEIQKIIHAIKYQKRFRTGELLGKLLGEKIRNENWNIDLIIPVPLHPLKRSERGYNQSFYIAWGVNKILHKRLDDNSLKRVKYTETQTAMNIVERVENISGAFASSHKKNITGKNILLIDDVITTGSTVSECGKILLENGAAKVFAASLAIAD
jgi:ComF family protein